MKELLLQSLEHEKGGVLVYWASMSGCSTRFPSVPR